VETPQERTEWEKTTLNRSEVFNYLHEQGNQICPEFVIDKEMEEYYFNLFSWFKGCKGDFDINKGLLICGPIGTGKTLSMRIMQHIFKNFPIVNTRYIIRDFFAAEKPTFVIDKYGRHSYEKTTSGGINIDKPRLQCFDDFGLENVNVKNYGNESNIMEEIILDRYDEFLSRGMKTIATTNLDVDLIEECYGVRVRDRLRQMMNYITLEGESKRK